jgi:mannose-1-phosphate guanylyltransferase
VVAPERIFIITGVSQRGICAKQVRGIPSQNIIGEPAPRGTAAAIGYAAVRLTVSDPEAELVVLPTDLIISPVKKFIRTVAAGVQVASRSDVLVTIGVKPTSPATGFGYIHRAEKFARLKGRKVYYVSAFKEKPDADTAIRFVGDGNHYWNSGIFIFRASSVLSAIERHMPALHSGLTRIRAAIGTRKEEKVTTREYSALESISIDNGVLERADNVKVLEADFDWQDVGSWLSFESGLPKDSDGNAVKGDFVSVASRNLVAVSENGVIAAAGVSDLIIVHTPDATLVCSKENAQNVRDIVKKLEEKNLNRYL